MRMKKEEEERRSSIMGAVLRLVWSRRIAGIVVLSCHCIAFILLTIGYFTPGWVDETDHYLYYFYPTGSGWCSIVGMFRHQCTVVNNLETFTGRKGKLCSLSVFNMYFRLSLWNEWYNKHIHTYIYCGHLIILFQLKTYVYIVNLVACNISVESSKPTKGPVVSLSIEQDILPLLFRTGWPQERWRAWFPNRT